MPHHLKFEDKKCFNAAVRTLWQILADTNQLNRDIGLPAVEFGNAISHRQGFALPAKAQFNKLFSLQWQEQPFQWQTGQFFKITREFQTGPVQIMQTQLRLQAEGDRTCVIVVLDIEFQKTLFRPFVQYTAQQSVRKIFKYVEQRLATFPAAAQKNKYHVHEPTLHRLVQKLNSEPIHTALLPLLQSHLLTQLPEVRKLFKTYGFTPRTVTCRLKGIDGKVRLTRACLPSSNHRAV